MKLGILLALGLILVGGAMSMSYVEQLGDESAICTRCMDGMKYMDAFIGPNLDKVVDYGLDKACQRVGFFFKWACKRVGKLLTKPMVSIIKKYLKGDKLCKLVGVCKGESNYYSVDDFDFSDEKTACVKCQLLVNKAKQIVVHEKELLKDVVMHMLEECENDQLGMPENMCTDMVNSFGVELVDAAIAEFSEFDACSASEVCY